ncbi:MAG: YbhB/YbcL family Raf kinase inhibitor-like protein [Spirochaetes bacterium]|nr:YbhB/YbcL family Raf kinase inhibitor-like protein [Spirochaetota bacterium]
MELQISSPSFQDGEMIPAKHTCDGDDLSPALEWSKVPDGTRSIAVICDDPDAPAGEWVHWVLFNLSGNIKRLADGIPADKALPNGAKQGVNDFNRIGYGGPCPPGRTVHRYFFKVFALNTNLELDSGITKFDLIKAMESHILAKGQLTGKYSRS